MLIVRKRKKKEVDDKAKARARGRAAILRLVFFSVLLTGLLGLFAYYNADYFSSLWESVASREAKPSIPAKPPKEYNRPASELLGLPEFFDASAATPLNSWLAEHMPEPDTSSRIHQALLSQPSQADSAKKEEEPDTLPRPLAVRAQPEPAKAVEPDTSERQARLTPAADADTVWPRVPIASPAAVAAPDSAEAAELVSLPSQLQKDTVATMSVNTEAGSMLISNIRCRLADREDIAIDVSVELFYAGRALHEELHFKRGTLATVLGGVMRRQEFGNVALPALSGELLDAFNDVLTSGQLSKVDVRNFRVIQ